MFKAALLGGDIRQIYLGSILAKAGHPVSLIGFSMEEYDNIFSAKARKKYSKFLSFYQPEDWETALIGQDLILGGIPFTKEQSYINIRSCRKPITVAQILSSLTPAQYLIAGMIPDSTIEHLKQAGIQYYDYLKNDSFAKLNAIATAEGAISYAIEHSAINLHQSKVLILGYGTCGSVLAEKCKLLNAHVTVTGRREETKAAAVCGGVTYIPISALEETLTAESYDFIFNTIPECILKRTMLSHISPECTIVDIASAPGGLDYNYAIRHQINATLYLGIPGKIAPKSSATILYDIILNQIKERSTLYVPQSI